MNQINQSLAIIEILLLTAALIVFYLILSFCDGAFFMSKLFQGLLIIFMITGCDAVETISIKNASKDTQIVTSNAAANLSVVMRSGSRDIVCFNSAPDAAPDVSSRFSLVGSGSEGYNASETEMSGRTPVLLMMRDSNFNLCKMYLNGVISKQQYYEMTNKSLEIFEKLMSAEIENTQISISEQNIAATKPPTSLFRDSGPKTDGAADASFGGASTGVSQNYTDVAPSTSIGGSGNGVAENSGVSTGSTQDCPEGTKWDSSISMCSF